MRKTHAPKVLLIILLLVIGALLIVATGTKLGDILVPNVEAGTDGDQQKPSETQTPDDQTPTPPPVTDPEPETPVVNPEPSFPVYPASSDRFLYAQEIEGKLCASHYTAKGYFIAVSLDGILYLYHMDEGGVLTGRAKLGEGEYLSSQLTSDGMAVLCKGQADSRLYLCDPQTLSFTALPLPKGNAAKFFASEEGFLLQIDDAVYHIRGGVITASAKLPSADLQEVFADAKGYTLILNTPDGFTVSMMDPTLKTYSENTVTGRAVLGFRPIAVDGKMKYAVLEREDGMLYLTVYDSSFRPASARRAGLGSGETGRLFSSEKGLFVLAEGEDPRMYLSDFELNFSLGDRTPFKGLTALYGVEQYAEGYLALLEKQDDLYLLDVRNDGTTATRHLDSDVNAATFHRTQNGAVFLSDGKTGEKQTVHIVRLNLKES